MKATKLIIICFLLSGCATSSKLHKQQDLNSSARIWINQTAAIEVEEAASNTNEIYIKYRAFLKDSESDEVFFVKASWQNNDQDEGWIANNFDVPLEFLDEEKWDNRPTDLVPVKILDETTSQKFKNILAHQLTPKMPGKATTIRLGDEELIFYYDKEDSLVIDDIKNKPPKITIENALTQEQLSESIINLLDTYLTDKNIGPGRVLLTTMQREDYMNPFMLVDIKGRYAVSLKVPLSSEYRYEYNMLDKGLKTADYLLVDSQVIGVVQRPFSTAFRLFNWTKGSTYDVVKPSTLALMENEPAPSLYQGEGMDLVKWEDKLDKIIDNNVHLGTMDYLIGGDQFFPRLIETITNAKKSIDIRIFIFDNDDYAVGIADLLKKKAKEGVKVRVLLDSMGQVMGEGKLPDDLPPGFIPPKSMAKYLAKNSTIEVRVRPGTLLKADHTKTITIDNKVCFTGGMNIGREYRYHWQDLMVELKGPLIAEINKEFNFAWEHSGAFGDIGYFKSRLFTLKQEAEGDGYPIRFLFTRVNDSQIFRAQVEAIKNAKKYIYINNAYFSDNTILYELIKARRRGVDVRVILPVHGNHGIMNISNIVTANIMFRNGIRVFFYPGMSHIKAAVYDGWLCTGSANFDKLSFRDNLEFNIATSNPAAVQKFIYVMFTPDFAKSKEMKQPLDSGLKERLGEFLAEQL